MPIITSRKCQRKTGKESCSLLIRCLRRPKEVDLEGEFEPNLLNSGVYLIQLSMQVSTFAINYQVTYRSKNVLAAPGTECLCLLCKGHPFRERIQDNKTLYYGLMSVGGIALAGATELFPEVNEQLKLVKFSSAVSNLELCYGTSGAVTLKHSGIVPR